MLDKSRARRALISAAFPMPLREMPTIALMHPTVRHPSLAGMRALPVTANPFVPTACPAPIAAQPDVSRGGRGPVFLYARWRGSNRDNRAYVVPVRGRGSDHASTEYYRQHGNCYQLACAKMGICHMHSRRIEGGRLRVATMALIVAPVSLTQYEQIRSHQGKADAGPSGHRFLVRCGQHATQQ